MGFPQRKDFTFTTKSACIRHVFALNDCTPSEYKTALGDLDVQSKQLRFHIQPVDTQSSTCSKAEKVDFSWWKSFRETTVLGRRQRLPCIGLRGMESPELMWGGSIKCVYQRNLSALSTPGPSWEIYTHTCAAEGCLALHGSHGSSQTMMLVSFIHKDMVLH